MGMFINAGFAAVVPGIEIWRQGFEGWGIPLVAGSGSVHRDE